MNAEVAVQQQERQEQRLLFLTFLIHTYHNIISF